MNMKQKAALKWATTRKLGRNKYLLWHGILGFGLGVSLLLTLFEFVTQQQITPIWVLIRCVVFPTVGFFIFTSRWDTMENKFAKFQQMQQNP